MRHSEGLVEVEVTYIGADEARVGETHLCVHVSTIHIYLTASVVYSVNDVADAALEYTVC